VNADVICQKVFVGILLLLLGAYRFKVSKSHKELTNTSSF